MTGTSHHKQLLKRNTTSPPSYINLTFAYNTETLGSLYSHTQLILTESKSKNQKVREQKFKDLLSSTCQVSVGKSMLDFET